MRVFVGASAAATLPAALAGAVLVSAPFAGTTTDRLSQDLPVDHSRVAASAPARAHDATGFGGGAGRGVAVLGVTELAFAALGAGVIVQVRRRRRPARLAAQRA